MSSPWSFAKRLVCFQHSSFSIFVTYLYCRSLYITCICTCTCPASIFTATLLPLFWGGGGRGYFWATSVDIIRYRFRYDEPPLNITSKHQHNEICCICSLHAFRDSVQHYAKVERAMLTEIDTVWHSETKQKTTDGIFWARKVAFNQYFWSKIHQHNSIAVRSTSKNQDYFIREQFFPGIYTVFTLNWTLYKPN